MEHLMKSTAVEDIPPSGIDAKKGIWFNEGVFGKGENTVYCSKHHFMTAVLADGPSVSQMLITALSNFIVPLIHGNLTVPGQYLYRYRPWTPLTLNILT